MKDTASSARNARQSTRDDVRVGGSGLRDIVRAHTMRQLLHV